MKILREDAIAICMALGYVTAVKWKKDRMNKKMKEIAEMDPDGLELEEETIDDPKELKRLNKILKAMGDAEEIEVVLEVVPEDDGADGSDPNPSKGEPAEEGDADAEPETEQPKKPKETKVTKKSVVIQILQRKGGATLEEMGEAITEAGVDDDTEKNTKTAGLWIRKIGFDVEFDKDSKKYQAKK